MAVNNVVLSGNLCKDAELRKNAHNTSILTFTVAINDRYKNQMTDVWETKAVFVPCIVFGNYADALAKYLFKGSEVFVAGKLNYRQWERDGSLMSKLEVIVSDARLIKQSNAQPQNQLSEQTCEIPF